MCGGGYGYGYGYGFFFCCDCECECEALNVSSGTFAKAPVCLVRVDLVDFASLQADTDWTGPDLKSSNAQSSAAESCGVRFG